MKLSFVASLFFLLLAANELPAQSPYLRQFTTSEGLPSNKVYRVFQDSRHFIWFATDAGVARFDGSHFKYYRKKDGINSNEIIRIEEDSQGRIWLFNFNGSFNFILNDVVYNSKNAPFLDSLYHNRLFKRFYEDDEQNVYFYDDSNRWIYMLGKDNQVQKFQIKREGEDGNNTTLFRNQVFPVALRKTENGLFEILSHVGKYRLTDLSQEVSHIETTPWVSLTFDSGNDVLYAELFDTLSKQPILVRFIDFNAVDTINTSFRRPNEQLINVYEDKTGRIWINSFFTGIYCVTDGKLTHHFNIARAQNVIQDHEGNYWFTSMSEGVFKLSPLFFDHYHFPTDYFNRGPVLALTKSRFGGVWLSNGQEVYLLKDSIIHSSGVLMQGATIDQLHHLHDDVLLVGESNLRVKALRKLSFKNGKLSYGEILSDTRSSKKITADSKNEIILINGHNYIQISKSDNIFQADVFIHLRNERLHYVYFNPNDDVFVNGKQIYIYKDDSLHVYQPLESFKEKIIRQHLNLNEETELFSIGGDSLYLFKNEKLYSLTTAFDRQIDEPFKWITYGHPLLFMATASHVYVSNNPFDAFDGNTVNVYAIELLFDNIHQILFNDGHLYIASNNGLTLIPSHKLINDEPPAPLPYFIEVSVNGEAQDADKNDIVLRGRNKIQLVMGSINYDPGRETFSYMLAGYDVIWNSGHENNIVYENLPPGKYTFMHRVKKSTTGWSEPATFFLHIKPVFWQHPLFYVLIAVVLIVGIYLAILQKKFVDLRKRETEFHLAQLEHKALVSLMNPHFIFNMLNSAQNFIVQNMASEASRYLSQFARLIRQNVTAINAGSLTIQDEIDQLSNYIQLERTRMNERFNISITHEDGLDVNSLTIPSMMLQPVVENAILHGVSGLGHEKGLITIHFSRHSEGAVKVVISDNGVGRSNGNGLAENSGNENLNISTSIIKRRLDLLGRRMNAATLFETVDAFPGNNPPGTRVTLVIPLMTKE